MGAYENHCLGPFSCNSKAMTAISAARVCFALFVRSDAVRSFSECLFVLERVLSVPCFPVIARQLVAPCMFAFGMGLWQHRDSEICAVAQSYSDASLSL